MMIARIGLFFLWIGGGFVAMFILSDIAHSPQPALLIYGLLLLLVGGIFRVRGSIPVEPNESRFRMLRKQKAEKPRKEDEKRSK